MRWTGIISIFFAFIAIIISATVLLLQFSPFLDVCGIAGGWGDGKIYFYIKNTGGIPAYSIKGRFIITSNKELQSQKTENEFKLAGELINTKQSVVFYPTGDKGKIPLIYTVDLEAVENKLKEIGLAREHTFLSIYFKYNQFKYLPWPWKTYEGVFYCRPDKIWVRTSHIHYPEFFSKIFKAFRENKEPKFKLNPLKN